MIASQLHKIVVMYYRSTIEEGIHGNEEDLTLDNELTDHDRELLTVYQHCWDDDKVDVDLIVSLLHKIVVMYYRSTTEEGIHGNEEDLTLDNELTDQDRELLTVNQHCWDDDKVDVDLIVSLLHKIVVMYYRSTTEEGIHGNEEDLTLDNELTDQDRELLTVYQHCWDDDKVDVDLIVSLLHKIVVMYYRSTIEEGIHSNEEDLTLDNELTDQDRELLTVYQHCWDDDKVDVDLIVSLLHKIVVMYYRSTIEEGIHSNEEDLTLDNELTDQDRELLTVYQHCWDDDKVDVVLIVSLLHKIVVMYYRSTIEEGIHGNEEDLTLDNELTDHDRELLTVYQHCWDDDKVDVVLIVSLLHKIVVMYYRSTIEEGIHGNEEDLTLDNELTDQDKELLIVYQHCWDDDKVDVDLIVSLLHKIVVMYYRSTIEEGIHGNEEDLTLDNELTDQDRELLTVYQHCWDDDKVDVDLIASLLHKIVVMYYRSTIEEGIHGN